MHGVTMKIVQYLFVKHQLLCVDRADLLPMSQYTCLYFRLSSSLFS